MSGRSAVPPSSARFQGVEVASRSHPALKLTRDERKAAFAGTLKTLRRRKRPESDEQKVIVSTTRGGRQVIDRQSGATVELTRRPRLWVVVKGWKLKPGSTEWEAQVTIHDHRERNRQLSAGLGGLPREAGLKTRWGKTVAVDGTVSEKRVPTRAEQHENWTPETERGYGGRGPGDLPSDAVSLDLEDGSVAATAVDDATLAEFSERAEPESQKLRQKRRQGERQGRLRMRLTQTRERGMTTAAASIERQLGSLG